MAGFELKPENTPTILSLSPTPQALPLRARQLVTALTYAIQTTPPPRNPLDRQELQRMNLQLFELAMRMNFLDLARDRLQAALALDRPEIGLRPEVKQQYENQLAQLNERIGQIQQRMSDLTLEQQIGPVQRGLFALQQGAPELAATELDTADKNGVSPTIVKPQLVDLYCDIGQPEKAQELLNIGNIEDPALETEPGMSTYRHGMVNLLLGNYEFAGGLWTDRSLTRLRMERGQQALMAAQEFLRGVLKAAPNTSGAINKFLKEPGWLGLQATWEYQLALCRLESGLPELAADHFTKALALLPDFALRPVIAYYLTQMGRPVPPSEKSKIAD